MIKEKLSRTSTEQTWHAFSMYSISYIFGAAAWYKKKTLFYISLHSIYFSLLLHVSGHIGDHLQGAPNCVEVYSKHGNYSYVNGKYLYAGVNL
jgi:hypothetical protein